MAMPKTMLDGMKTTVSLTDEVRNRLAALAARNGRTMGEEIAAMVDRAEYDVFWADVAAGYDDAASAGVPMVVHDDYPEYAHMRRPEVPAEGAHNEPAPATRPRRRRASA
jgi:predicted transcriptional regulator